jgi:hypothetical protein
MVAVQTGLQGVLTALRSGVEGLNTTMCGCDGHGRPGDEGPSSGRGSGYAGTLQAERIRRLRQMRHTGALGGVEWR